jgi:hypothetical protein
MLQLYFNNNNTRYNLVDIYNVYNLFSNNYNKIIDKSNLLTIKLTLRIQDKSIIVRIYIYFFLSKLFLF